MTLSQLAVKNYRIVLHILICAFLISFPLFLHADDPMFRLTHWIVMSGILTVTYFINTLYIIPNTLIIGKYTKYILLLIACSVATWVIFELLTTYALPQTAAIIPTLPPLPPEEFKGSLSLPPIDFNRPRFKQPVILPFPMIFHLAIGTTIELIFNWESQKKEREKIEKERILTELSFLKFQINPHFLFNTLNNIYVLTEKKSDKAGEAVLILSNMMRYMLYDSNNGKILLQKEIEYLKNYITIQGLRISQEEDVNISFKITGEGSSIMIEPLVLISFIENAFKHGISYNQKSKIDVLLQITNHVITLLVSNTKRKAINSETKLTNGIGLTNARKRLEILYPKAHELTIHDLPDRFEVMLKLYPN